MPYLGCRAPIQSKIAMNVTYHKIINLLKNYKMLVVCDFLLCVCNLVVQSLNIY